MAIKVLVLDDEREIVESLKKFLEMEGDFEVLGETDPERALELIGRENVQLVLCDIVMPKMDGLEFLEAAKSVNGLVQVVMMSAYSTVDRVIAALERGAADYLMKPLDLNELKEVLKEQVKRLSRWRDLVVRARAVQDASSQKPSPEETSSSPLSLIESLEREKDQFRREELLGRLREHLARNPEEEVVRRALSSPDPFVRNSVLEVGRSWGEEVVPLLKRLLQDENHHLRKLVLDLAFYVPGDGVLEVFREALSDPDPNVRMTALEYLGERGDKAAYLVIVKLLEEEKEPMLLATIFETLAEICEEGKTEELLKKFREGLDPLLRRSFLKLVSACGGEENISWLEEEVLKGRWPLSREVVDAFISLLSRYPEGKVSSDFLRLLKEQVMFEREPLGVYQVLKLISLINPEEARGLAEGLKTSSQEALSVGAEEFLADVCED